MSSVGKVIRPRAEVTFTPALGLQVSGVNVISELNQPPHAELQTHPTNVREDTPTRLLDASVCRQLARLQARLFSEAATAADAEVVLLDGSEVKLTFRGKLASGNYNWGFGPPSLPHTVTGAVGALSALDWSVYLPREIDREKSLSPLAGLAPTSDICAVIKFVTQRLVKNSLSPAEVNAEVGRVDASVLADDVERGQTDNKPLLEIFYAVLDAAPVRFPSLPSLFPRLERGLVDTIQSCLREAPDGFSSLLALCAEFGMVFVPGTGAPGKLVRLDALLDAPSSTLVLDAESTSATVGDVGWLPVRCVSVVAPVSLWRAGPPKKADSLLVGDGAFVRAYQQYPNNVPGGASGGLRKKINPPRWLKDNLQGLPNERAVGAPSNNLETLKQDVAKEDKAEANYTAQIRQLLKDWAKLKYAEDVLRSSSVVLGLPLGYWDVNVGDNVAFRDADGTALFSGIVAKVIQSFSSEQGSAKAGTTLHLSYVRFSDWTPLIE